MPTPCADAVLTVLTRYHLLTAPPKREAIFSQQKEVHGTKFAFHGSRVENWHSILRNGLVNASGTKMQVNGAAYGSGVYLSPMAALSIKYSGHNPGQAPPRRAHHVGGGGGGAASGSDACKEIGFLRSAHLIVIAVCEIVKSDGLKEHNTQIWTHTNADHVVTRMLFVSVSRLGRVVLRGVAWRGVVSTLDQALAARCWPHPVPTHRRPPPPICLTLPH